MIPKLPKKITLLSSNVQANDSDLDGDAPDYWNFG